MDDLEINKDLYYSELEHSNKISDRNFNLLTVLSIIGAGESILLQDIFPIQLNLWCCLYMIICLISAIIFVIAIIRFMNCFRKHPYSYIDTDAINKDCSRKQTELKNRNVSSEQISKDITSLYIRLLSEGFLNCALQNRITNVAKNSENSNLTRSVMHSFIALIVNYVFYLIYHNLKEGNLYVWDRQKH